MTIAAFELIPTDIIYEKLFNSDPDGGNPIDTNFADLGFEHHLLMQNFGSLGFFCAMLVPVYLISFLIKCFRKYKCCGRMYKKLAKKLYWSIVLRTIIESYVIGLICCFVNALNLDFSREDPWTFANTMLTVIVGPLLILFPVIATFYMYMNWNQLVTMEVTYGELYHGFNIKGSKAMLIFWFTDFLRK